MLLKTKYGKVDAKISFIARRAELALYSQAFSSWEYRNPQTLSRRLHSLVVKLHLNNLAAKEDGAFAAEEAQIKALFTRNSESAGPISMVQTRKRRRGVPVRSSGKRQRVAESAAMVSRGSATGSSLLFFDGNHDLVQHVSSFLHSREILRCSATGTTANQIFPGFVTNIQVSPRALDTLSFENRALFFAKFLNLESFTLQGCAAQAQQYDFQNEAKFISRNVVARSLLASLSYTPLSKLKRFGLNYAYTEGLQDRITIQVASVLLASSDRFPRLQELSLIGNGVSDDGAVALCDALTLPGAAAATATARGKHPLCELHLEQNFIGERGFLHFRDSVELFASRGRAIAVSVKGNLGSAVA